MCTSSKAMNIRICTYEFVSTLQCKSMVTPIPAKPSFLLNIFPNCQTQRNKIRFIFLCFKSYSGQVFNAEQFLGCTAMPDPLYPLYEKAYLDQPPLFPFSSCFARVCWGFDQETLAHEPTVFSRWSPGFAPSRVSFCGVLQVNQKHRWDQYQDRPALPVWTQCSRKFTNSQSAPHTALQQSQRRQTQECQWPS